MGAFSCVRALLIEESVVVSDHHLFHARLPRNPREFAFFLLVISLISVNVIPVLISGLTAGFSWHTWGGVLRVQPVLWLTVVAAVLATRKPAQMLAARVVRPGDSFRAHVLADTLCSVFLMSLVLTVAGTWIGTWSISTDPLTGFAHLWPRNFAIALVVEALLAQPVARALMHRYHRWADARAERVQVRV